MRGVCVVFSVASKLSQKARVPFVGVVLPSKRAQTTQVCASFLRVQHETVKEMLEEW